MVKYLEPMRLREFYYAGIEREIQRLFDLVLYRPLARILTARHPDEILNSVRALVRAISRGNVWYEDGQFKGQFNSQLVKELRELGASFNPSGTWSLRREDIPPELQFAQAAAESRYEAMRRDLLTALDNVQVSIIDQESRTAPEYGRAVDRMEGDFKKTIRASSTYKSVIIAPELTADQQAMIAKEWGTNLDLYIKNWTEENIFKLRQQIQSPVLHGARAESLISMIQQNYGVSKNKAKFLAHQETSLLMAQFRETRYSAIGIRRYKWSTSHDERVRHDHRELNGKIFFFSEPPVTNKKTGDRNNPGEDFGCRCTAVGLID